MKKLTASRAFMLEEEGRQSIASANSGELGIILAFGQAERTIAMAPKRRMISAIENAVTVVGHERLGRRRQPEPGFFGRRVHGRAIASLPVARMTAIAAACERLRRKSGFAVITE